SNLCKNAFDLIQEVTAQPRAPLFIPVKSTDDLVAHQRVEVERQAHGFVSALARICSQVTAIPGLAFNSASRRANSARCSAVSRAGGRASPRLSQISKASATRCSGLS